MLNIYGASVSSKVCPLERLSFNRDFIMKKVLIADELRGLFADQEGLLERSDIRLFTAHTNEDVLRIHRKERVDLIITQIDMPGVRSEELFNIIRASEELRHVSTIIVCKDTLDLRQRCRRCRANFTFTLPVDGTLLYQKVEQFLSIVPRRSYRAMLAVAIQGKFKNKPLSFRTENISASGMLIRSEEPLAQGDGIFFSFFLSDGTHASGYGEIARVVQVKAAPETYQYGIKFTNVDDDVKSALEKAVKK